MLAVVTKRHYAPTDASVQNLLREGTDPATVLNTGNTVIDALLSISQRLDHNRNSPAKSTRTFPSPHPANA
jgi:UDP-N-acetylglucosamine 2-epimerase (non-hydrolysing)